MVLKDMWPSLHQTQNITSYYLPHSRMCKQPVETNIYEINRLFNRSPMQTKNSQIEGKRIMPETRFTELPAVSVDPRIGIYQSASETDV